MHIPQNILAQYNLSNYNHITTLSSGLINQTYKITNAANEGFILQKINTKVFTNPTTIANNISSVANYLLQHHPNYLLPIPIPTVTNQPMAVINNDYWRLFAYVPHSHSKTSVTTSEQAYQAAKQFGQFTKLLAPFNATTLQTTLPNFHNLTLRYQQFEQCLLVGNSSRIKEAKAEIDYLVAQQHIVKQFETLATNKNISLRVTHHDTKISNVLFNESDKALCVIDLDTLMPGYFISDVGDMMRTYLCTATEEEQDTTAITIRPAYYNAIKEGYLSQMATILSAAELTLFHYSGSFIIYMQALRFITDYLNNDVYYTTTYENQNLIRAKNQITLLEHYKQLVNDM